MVQQQDNWTSTTCTINRQKLGIMMLLQFHLPSYTFDNHWSLKKESTFKIFPRNTSTHKTINFHIAMGPHPCHIHVGMSNSLQLLQCLVAHPSQVVSSSYVQVIPILDLITGTTTHQSPTSSCVTSKWSQPYSCSTI